MFPPHQKKWQASLYEKFVEEKSLYKFPYEHTNNKIKKDRWAFRFVFFFYQSALRTIYIV
ncbi:MAG: hypothetical protein C0391_02205 [Anaerolinea sp.]|nr:hypothetical protein [Anaerolinea sp.]